MVHRDGTTSNQMAPLKKNIYCLSFLADNLKGPNRRYLEFISAFGNKGIGHKRLENVTSSKSEIGTIKALTSSVQLICLY